ncbi:MAG: hypothetical protein ACWGPS_07530, partial [Candidatus Promineifilaceae bacterium]
MNKPRFFAVLLVNLMVVVLLSAVLAVSALAASMSETGARTQSAVPALAQAGTATMQILNVNSGTGQILAYYDHNKPDPKLRGTYVGARVCAVGTVNDLEVVMTGFPAFDGDPQHPTIPDAGGAVSEFELGWGETPTRTFATLSDECAVAYFYVLTPRDSTGPPPPSATPTQGPFSIELYVGGALQDTQNQTIRMIRSPEAAPGQVVSVIEESADFFTLTVSYDLGNVAAQNGYATFLPTSYVGHNAGKFDLIATYLTITGTTFVDEPDVIYAEGITVQNLRGYDIYVFHKLTTGGMFFYPVQIANSGGEDKHNISSVGVPLAIELRAISVGSDQLPLLLTAAAV